MGSAGLVRSLKSFENTILVGHSSGHISLLDIRTGRLAHSWKAHEGEVLNLTPLNRDEFISTSLDQTVTIHSFSGKTKGNLSGAAEPVHCVSYVEESDEIIIGTTGNRIGIHHGTSTDSPLQFTKLRSDIVRGNLTSMGVLPMNRLLLIGQDNGTLTLMS